MEKEGWFESCDSYKNDIYLLNNLNRYLKGTFT